MFLAHILKVFIALVCPLTTVAYIKILVSLILNDVPYILDTYHFKPAVDVAVDTINKLAQSGVYLNFSLSYIYRTTDANCGSPVLTAPGVASDVYYTYKVAAIFGPLCSGETSPVADLASHWNIPLLSGVSTSGLLDNKARYRTLTRTAFKASNLVNFMSEIFRRYKWRRCAIVWDDLGSYWRTVLAPSLFKRFEQDGVLYQDVAISNYKTLEECMKAAIKKETSKYIIMQLVCCKHVSVCCHAALLVENYTSMCTATFHKPYLYIDSF